jgi:putative phosphoribosyl transferase
MRAIQQKGDFVGGRLMDKTQGWSNTTYTVPVEVGITLEGNLNIPHNPRGVVLFVHGSGSSRFSPRNQFVARQLHSTGLATLLIDLLTAREEEEDRYTGHLRFDIQLLSRRVVAATNWLSFQPATRNLKIGYFGASTGAAAALVAAAERLSDVGAIVSRGGRPDLAGPALPAVQAPTLLLVGSMDTQVIELNRMAFSLLRCEKRMEIIPGASHLFEEPGTLEEVAELAGEWFTRYLTV